MSQDETRRDERVTEPGVDCIGESGEQLGGEGGATGSGGPPVKLTRLRHFVVLLRHSYILQPINMSKLTERERDLVTTTFLNGSSPV